MLPVITKLGPFPIYSFGVFLALAVLLGTFVSWRKAREYHLEDEEFFDLIFSGMMGGILAGRAWYVVEHFSDFGFNVIKWLWFTHFIGISFMGAVIGALLAIMFIARHYDLDPFEMLDLTSIGGSLGLSLSWVGAFLDGFPVGVQVSRFGLPLPGLEGLFFPVHFVAIGGFFLLYILLIYWEPKYRTFEWYRAGRSSAKSGFLFSTFLIGMGLLHLVTSQLVANPGISIVIPLDSWFGLLVASAGAVLIYTRSGRKLKNDLANLKLPKMAKKSRYNR